MVSTTTKTRRRTAAPVKALSMFVEIRGEATPDLRELATDGICPRCDSGTCLPIPAYLRISADRFDDDASLTDLKADRGVVRQAQDMVRLVDDDTEHVILFVDNDLSASKKRKEAAAWWAALDYVRNERPAKLLGVKHDRLGRRMADLEDLEDICRATGDSGTRVITLADGDLFANPAWPFLAAMAKTEARNTSFRVKLAQASRRAKGLDTGGGNRPYGYEADRLTIVEHEAAIIRELAQRLIDGESGHGLARDMNERGIPTPGNKGPWVPRTVRRMLANPRYAGMRTENSREHSYRVVGEAAWPAILDRETWEQLYATLKAASGTRGGRPHLSMLGGIARCGYCETPLHAGQITNSYGAREKRYTYRCPKMMNGCGRVHRSRTPIDEYVVKFALSLVNADVAANEAHAVRERVDTIESRRAALDLEALTNREEYASGRLDPDAYYMKRDRLAAEARTLEKEWRAGVAELDDLTAETTAVHLWESWTVERRRRFLRSKLSAVLVFRAKAHGTAARVVQPGEVEIIPKPTADLPHAA
jgi:DNA invertase Pin-like site-specific DNA recombinase